MAHDSAGKAGNKLAYADIRSYIHNLREFTAAIARIETKMLHLQQRIAKNRDEAPQRS